MKRLYAVKFLDDYSRLHVRYVWSETAQSAVARVWQKSQVDHVRSVKDMTGRVVSILLVLGVLAALAVCQTLLADAAHKGIIHDHEAYRRFAEPSTSPQRSC